MRINLTFSKVLAVVAVGGLMIAPMSSMAQSRHRQETKNQWRNLAYVGAAAGLLGLLRHDNTLTLAGAAGAAYSAYRYEQDRKSQNRSRHYARYSSYGHSYYSSYTRRHSRRSHRHNNNGRHLGWYKH